MHMSQTFSASGLHLARLYGSDVIRTSASKFPVGRRYPPSYGREDARCLFFSFLAKSHVYAPFWEGRSFFCFAMPQSLSELCGQKLIISGPIVVRTLWVRHMR